MDNQNIAPAIHERKGHTPGPWVIDPRHYWDKEIGIRQDADGWHRLYCEVDRDDCDHDTAEANARLVAAAPELLEALKSLVNSLAENDEDGMTEFSDDMVRARAAITKAEG